MIRPLLLALCLLAPPLLQAQEEARININTASAETLATMLNGVGMSKAKAIIAHREQHGDFQSVDDLTQVQGIGPSTLKRNRELLSIE